MANDKQQWFKCELDKKTLKRLMRRQDKPALIHFGLFFGSLILLALITTLLWGSWWAAPVYILYCLIWAFATSAVHETCHGSPFKTRWLNEACLFISGWMMQMEPVAARWGHAGHHSYTHFDKGDTELALANPLPMGEFLRQVSGLGAVHRYYHELLMLCFMRQVPRIEGIIPEQEMPKAARNARWIMGTYLLVLAWSIASASWLPAALLLLPRFVGAPAVGVFRVTQHAGLAMNVQDHRQTTRTFYTNPVFEFLYFRMNYHVEHHMYPLVPFYNLPELHRLVKDQLPEPLDGLDEVLKEILYAIERQRTEPGFYVKKLPEPLAAQAA